MSTVAFTKAKAAMDGLQTVPYAMGQYLTADGSDLPDTFVVYSLVYGDAEQHADNWEMARSYLMQVSIYARGGLANIPDVDSAMLAQGFQRGPERQLPYDEKTRHYGLARDYIYLESEEIPN